MKFITRTLLKIVVFIVSLFLFACSKQREKDLDDVQKYYCMEYEFLAHESYNNVSISAPEASFIPEQQFKFYIADFSDSYTSDQQQSVRTIVKLVEQIINSSEFQAAVLEQKFWFKQIVHGQKQFSIRPSSEVLNRIQTVKKNISFDKVKRKGVAGMAEKSGSKIYFNSERPLEETATIARTLMHEYAHCLGYGHSSGVPYKLGSLVKHIIERASNTQ